MNTYAVGNCLLFLGLVEVAVVCWRYGAWRLMKNIKTMHGNPPCILWKYTWYILTPGLLLFAIIFSCINYTPLSYDTYIYPTWANWLGLGLMMISLLPVPIYAIYHFVEYSRSPAGKNKSALKILQEISSPTEDWGPFLRKYRFTFTE